MNPKVNFENFDKLTRINALCARIYKNQRDIESVKELQNVVNNTSPTILKTLEPIIFSAFFPVLKSISDRKSSFKTAEKEQIVVTFMSLFNKINIDKLPLFFNLYGFLLFEIYDPVNHKVLDSSEEYKLSIVDCTTSLLKSLSSPVVDALYVKENAPKLCQMIYVLLELAKNEQFKTLRISAINCTMAMARVLDDDFDDLVIRNQVAEVFLFFLPGVASQLQFIALSDEKYGHKIPSVALKAWGRIVTLLMQDYGPFDHKINLTEARSAPTKPHGSSTHQWKDESEIKEYIRKTQRSPEWYQETDKKLQKIIVEFLKIAHHSHPNVRLELATMASLLINNCIRTMPTSVSHLIDIVIVLSEDSDGKVSREGRSILENLSQQLTSSEFKSLLDNLEEGFYGVIASIPRKFNGIDEREQIVALNSLIGYIRLFGKHTLTSVLHSTVHLNKLLLTLIHITDFDKSGVSTLGEYTTSEYEVQQGVKSPWKQFRYFKDDLILHKIENVCHLLAEFGASSIVSDFLLDMIVSNSEQRKEAVFLLNEIVTGLPRHDQNLNIIKNVITTYTDKSFWYIPLSVGVDETGYEYTLSDVQDNIIQVCLLVEGVGKTALSLNKQFEQFMLKTLYLVLERAGSAHPFIRAAGSVALSNISKACDYSNITHLINANMDYFSFHIERRLNKAKNNEGGLNVLAVVIRYSSKEVLHSTCEIVRELLMQTYDKQKINLNDYLYVFRMFIHCLHRWLAIEPHEEPFKTKKEKQEAFEDFKVSNIDENVAEDFSDDIMGKTAEEMCQEDMEKVEKEPEQYKKPEPPIHIKLTVAIFSKSLHCLPSKDQARKLLVLEILKDGLPILKEWEDELLPIVHQIWSPLVDRFKETDPLIINYSFQLLVVLARLSKDFIRSRTARDVLPNLLRVLENLSEESYLKDKGSAYRYSQNFKLQQMLLEKLAGVVTDLDMLQTDFDKTMDVVFKYLSDKQPLPLQRAAVQFFALLQTYDPRPTSEKIDSLSSVGNEYEKNVAELRKLVRKSE